MTLEQRKKLLVYLYHICDKKQSLIYKEILEHKIKAEEKDVEKYIKDNKINLSRYVCFFEKGFKKVGKTENHVPILIYEKLALLS